MKSKISFFNLGLCKNLLRRSWPLWAAYLLVLIVILPVEMVNRLNAITLQIGYRYMDLYLLESAKNILYVSFVAGVLAAMAMFSFLYNTRGCGMIHTLPLKRETVFGTAWLTGLVPMLLCDVLVFAVTALTMGRYFESANLWTWLTMAVCSNLAFYGFASFCAMLTGSLVILPAVYVVLNLAAWVLESCVSNVLEKLVYGYATPGEKLLWLSPIAKINFDVHAATEGNGAPFQLFHKEAVLIYAVAGLVLSVISLLLYRRRQLETATDAVAIPVLKPIFKYCMAFGTAFVLCSVTYSLLLGGGFDGRIAPVLVLFLLLLGAFIGYFAAEMLLQKTVRVFAGKWKGLAVVCLILIAFSAVAEFGFFGYEDRVPDPEQVESVWLRYGVQLQEPENIRMATELHRSLLSHKAQHERELKGSGSFIRIEYKLKNGKTLSRMYYVANGDSDSSVDATDLLLTQEILNTPEALDIQNKINTPVTAENIYSLELYESWYTDNVINRDGIAHLTPEQGEEFFRDCVIPDLQDHVLGRTWLVHDDAYFDTVMNVGIQLDMRIIEGEDLIDWDWYSFELNADSVRCLEWIRENTDLEPVTLREAGVEKAAYG